MKRYDDLATSLLNLGLIGVWAQKPLVDGSVMKAEVLRGIPKGPAFREVMDEQERWMVTHPGGTRGGLRRHMREMFPNFVGEEGEGELNGTTTGATKKAATAAVEGKEDR